MSVYTSSLSPHCGLFIQPLWRPLPHPLCQHSGQSSPEQQPSWPSSSLWSGRTADKPAEGKPAGPTGQWWPRTVTPACRLHGGMMGKGWEGQEWESKYFKWPLLMCWNSSAWIQQKKKGNYFFFFTIKQLFRPYFVLTPVSCISTKQCSTEKLGGGLYVGRVGKVILEM